MVRDHHEARGWRLLPRWMIASLIGFAALTLPLPVSATSCVSPARPLAEVVRQGIPESRDGGPPAMFVGVVRSIEPAVLSDLGGGSETVFTPIVFDVEASLIGEVGSVAVVMNNGGRAPGSDQVLHNTSTFGFDEGLRYLVSATTNRDETFSTSVCTFTRRITAEGARRLIELAPDGDAEPEPTSLPAFLSAKGAAAAEEDSSGRASTTSIVIGAVAGVVFSTAIMLILRRRRLERERSAPPNDRD